MSKALKIISAAVLIIGIITFPVWYNRMFGTVHIPEPELKGLHKECIKSAAYMRENHMVLLHQWRDDVVRKGNRKKIMINGNLYERSLTKTCIKCHDNKEKFCDRCHSSVSVEPKCWNCHLTGKEQ